AAYHVLHRLCMPRHPPNALTTLNRSHCQCSSSLFDLADLVRFAFASRDAKSDHPDNLAIAVQSGQTCVITFYNHAF
ncbi:hypothetical protein, partial [Rhizobium leguminosarum]|uniref:hypothetical protein n=1 Tax=Rhizobium leguminosarum TaxID=384 RepID=UPI00197E33B3